LSKNGVNLGPVYGVNGGFGQQWVKNQEMNMFTIEENIK
jgi:hypothetical protein